ncbi:MAG: ABC transporter ATP-binding protein/permease [Treponema sp.]|nr:ABC transporter ATP-binding protein/permease [Treponema sp.]
MKPLIALFFSARILNELSGECNVQLIIFYVLTTVLSVFVLSVTGALINQRLNVLNNYTYSKLEFLYVKRYMEMDYPNIEDNQVNQMLADIRARANGNWLGLINLSSILPSLVNSIVTLVVSLAMLAGMFVAAGAYTQNWVTSPAATVILAALAALSVMTPIVLRKWQKAAYEMIERENPKANTLFGFYNDYKNVKNAAKDIRLYNQAKTLSDIFDKRLNHRIWIWFFRRFADANSVSGAVSALTGGAVYLFIGLRALYGMYSIGSVVQYVGAISNIINNMSGITGNIGTLLNNIVYMQNTYDFLDLNDPRSSGDRIPDAQNIHIEFDNVSFKYPGTDIYALRNVNLRFKSGKRLAVVGMNGSGKTTMVKLLCRLYQPTTGVIRLNDEDIQNYSHSDYMRLFNVVFQDFKLFSLSLGGNVATADDYDRERVKKVLVSAGFGEKLSSLEKGLDTMLGKDCDKEGVSLSGGEEQKVAIARAIYRDSPFVVFDEPTAALDPISEYEVYTKLNEIVGGKTAVFISHRLSSCRFCDDIAVFHEGALIQYGDHDTLLTDKNGKYYELWNAQAQHYTDTFP